MSATVNRRPARREDVLSFFGQLPQSSVKATVWEGDGKVLAIAGSWLLPNGVRMVFSDIAEDVNAPAIRIAREAIAFMKTLDKTCLCVADNERAEAFLDRLGWTHLASSEEGEIYQWQF